MITVYIDTNFGIEIVLQQEEASFVEEILKLAEAQKIKLVIPAFCITEMYTTVLGKEKKYKQIVNEATKGLAELLRSSQTMPVRSKLNEMNQEWSQVSLNMMQQLTIVSKRLRGVCDVLSTDNEVLNVLDNNSHGLSAQDSIVANSALKALASAPASSKNLFLARDGQMIRDTWLKAELAKLNCKAISSFKNGFEYIKSQTP